MTLICKLNQHVVHAFGGTVRHCHEVGGYFRNSREYPDCSASLADSWGGNILQPSIYLSVDNRLQRSKLSLVLSYCVKYYKRRISLTRLNMDGFISCAIFRTTDKFIFLLLFGQC